MARPQKLNDHFCHYGPAHVLSRLTRIISRPHEFLRNNFVLTGHQLVNGELVVEEKFHANEGFFPLLREHVILFRPCEQIRHGALGQAEDGLAEQALAD